MNIILLLCVALLTFAGCQNVEEICAAHEKGRNCKTLNTTLSNLAIQSAGCAGMHLAYAGAVLSSASYLDWDLIPLESAALPGKLQFAYGPCRAVQTPRRQGLENSRSAIAKKIYSLAGAVIQRVKFVLDSHLMRHFTLHIGTLAEKALHVARRIFQAVACRFDETRSNCPPRKHLNARDTRSCTITPLWFFSDWKDGFWHDTEVLIAGSATARYIIFRGSDSPADAVTSSQTYVPARRVDRFPSISTGSFHRGILNAYSRVHSGRLTFLGEALESWQARDPFFKELQDAFEMCHEQQSQPLTSNSGSRTANYFRGSKCSMSERRLSDILVAATTAGLKSGVKVIISGHSLGGGLATLLAIDVLVNWPGGSHDRRFGAADQTIDDTRYDWFYDDSALSRVEASTHDHPISNLYLVTFGEPEVADTALFNHLLSQDQSVKHFADCNHLRFVSLAKYPYCGQDIVTGSLTYANDLLGDLVMGKGGGFWGRVQCRAEQRAAQRSAGSVGSAVPVQQGSELGPQAGTEASPRFLQGLITAKSEKLLQTPVDGQGYLGNPIYLSSGHAMSAFSAHSVIHYVQGLTRALNSNRLVECNFDYPWHTYKSSLDLQSLNISALRESGCMRCYMACDLPEYTNAMVLYSSGGCKFYDDNNDFFSLFC